MLTKGYTVLSYFKLANINFNKKDFQSMENIMIKLLAWIILIKFIKIML